ncbi:MAG: hypothetical protein JRI97_09980, partial [Deltaproteobacteria bacterium]|nr:hypothetical protein [Deltaproteobacteria bacterium]
VSAPTGFIAKATGWAPYFLACAVIALPGLLLLLKFSDWAAGRKPIFENERYDRP